MLVAQHVPWWPPRSDVWVLGLRDEDATEPLLRRRRGRVVVLDGIHVLKVKEDGALVPSHFDAQRVLAAHRESRRLEQPHRTTTELCVECGVVVNSHRAALGPCGARQSVALAKH